MTYTALVALVAYLASVAYPGPMCDPESEVAREAAEIERKLGTEKLREVAVYRFQRWLDKSHEAERKGRDATYERRKAYLWGQCHVRPAAFLAADTRPQSDDRGRGRFPDEREPGGCIGE